MVSNAVKELRAAKQQLVAKIRGLESEARQIDAAIAALSGLSGGAAASPVKTRKMSAAGRKAIAAAARARWAKVRAGKAPVAKRKKRQMSAAAKAKLSAFQKARWAKIKAAKK